METEGMIDLNPRHVQRDGNDSSFWNSLNHDKPKQGPEEIQAALRQERERWKRQR